MIMSAVNELLEKDSSQLSQVNVDSFSLEEISIIEESINQDKDENVNFSEKYLWL
ncbi:hypothetical protein ACFSKI_21940 [Pseudogracilibacillus auburnensis]|nr:hypothetical protein [Pseudogracilibacillus auburnensis]